MAPPARAATAARTIQEVALEAARRASRRNAATVRELVGEAWLHALSFGDRVCEAAAFEEAVEQVARLLDTDARERVDGPPPAPAIHSWRASTPFGPAVEAQQAGILHRAIDRMPGRLASLLMLRHGLGCEPPMEPEAMAELVGIPSEDVRTALSSATRLLRADLLSYRLDAVDGCDEAIVQPACRSPFRVALRPVGEAAAVRIFREGVAAGTHALVDTPAKAAARAMAAEASERIDPRWIERDVRRREDAERDRMSSIARGRAHLAAASAVATLAAIDTPTLSVGLKPDDSNTRFRVYAFDGRGGEGAAMLGGRFLTPSEMAARSDDLKADLARYRDRDARPTGAASREGGRMASDGRRSWKSGAARNGSEA